MTELCQMVPPFDYRVTIYQHFGDMFLDTFWRLVREEGVPISFLESITCIFHSEYPDEVRFRMRYHDQVISRRCSLKPEPSDNKLWTPYSVGRKIIRVVREMYQTYVQDSGVSLPRQELCYGRILYRDCVVMD